MPGAGMAVDADDRAVIFGAELDPRDVAEPDRRAARVGLEDDLRNCSGVWSLRLRGDRRVEHLLVGLRQPADLARRDFGVLRSGSR